jgi:hypothetical protein
MLSYEDFQSIVRQDMMDQGRWSEDLESCFSDLSDMVGHPSYQFYAPNVASAMYGYDRGIWLYGEPGGD